MRTRFAFAALAALGLSLAPLAPLAAQEASDRPVVDVVFVLDTTGSMGGLIEGAKQKIWAIVNEIAGGKPSPAIRVGLVAYRDKGDDYVTKKVELTDDLDAMYAQLMGFEANGGGDGPEHVNEALRMGVHDMAWTPGDKVLRIVFLVGDAEPHMDYADDVKYAATCETAVKAGIVINTVRCGADATTARIWQEIADLSEGKFASIAQDGGVVAVATPFDGQLAGLNGELNGTFVYHGSEEGRLGAKEKLDADDRAAGAASPSAAGERAMWKARKSAESDSSYTRGDLVTESQCEDFDPKNVKDEELPENMRSMSPEERKTYLDGLAARRAEIQKKMAEVSAERDAFIKAELAKRGAEKSGFDAEVFEMIKEQGAEKGIEYEDK